MLNLPNWKKFSSSPDSSNPPDSDQQELVVRHSLGLLVLCGVSAIILQTSIFPQFALVPDILLILCVYIGIYYRSFGGAAGTFFLGYVLDNCSGTPVGTHAFAFSLVFALVAAASPFLWLNNPLSVLSLVIAAVLLKTGIFFFLSPAGQPSAWFQPVLVRYILWDVAVALLLTPAIFGLLYRKVRKVEPAT